MHVTQRDASIWGKSAEAFRDLVSVPQGSTRHYKPVSAHATRTRVGTLPSTSGFRDVPLSLTASMDETVEYIIPLGTSANHVAPSIRNQA